MLIGFDRTFCIILMNRQDAYSTKSEFSIALSNQPTQKIMTTTEILAALKNLTAEERLEIIEAASRMMREEIEEKVQRKAERKQKLKAAAAAAVKDYMPGGALYDLWSSDSEPYFDSEEESLNAGIKTNA